MDWTEFTGNVKDSSLPFYLSDTEDQTENVYCQNIHPTLITHLSSKEFFFHRQPSGDLSIEGSPGAGYGFGIDNVILKASSPKRSLQSYLTKQIQDLLTNPSKTIPLKSQRIRCSSLERVSLDELKIFYRYHHSTKVIKKMCDTNLWLLIHELSSIFQQKDSSKQPLLLDLGRLMLHFIFCSINQLRFEQCRNILEKLEKLENCFYEGSSIKVSAPKSVGMSPMQGSPHGNKQVSLINLPKTPQSYSPNPMTPISGRPPTHPSLSHLAPRLNASNSILSATPKARQNISLAMQQAAESNIKHHANRKILILIGKVKYTIAQIGHFLHYDHQSNRVMDLLTKKNRDRGEEKSNNSSTSIPNVNMYTPNNKETQKKVFNFTAAYDSSAMNSPIQLQRMDKADEKSLLYQNVTSSSNLKYYFYNTQNFLDDYDEQHLTRRQELLTKYCKYKMQKWVDNRAREKLEQKYEDFKIVCKLCANKVPIDKMKEHSKLCRRNMELDKEIKDFDNKISDLVFKAFMGSKELHTKYVVDSKRYTKLKAEISKEVDAAGLLVPKKLSKGEHSKKDQGSSLLFRSGTVNSSAIKAVIEGFNTPKAGGSGENTQQNNIRPAPEKRRAFLFSGMTLKQLQAEDTTPNPLYNSFVTDRVNSELSHKTHSPERETGSQDKSQKNESVASNEIESPLRKKKHPILDMLNPQNHTRRYSADLDKEKTEPRQKKLSTFAKRDGVRGIDTNALQNMLLTLNNDKEQSAGSPQKIRATNEIHSVGIRTPSNERSRSASLDSGDLTQFQEESQIGSIVDDGPPLITQTKSMTPFIKAQIYELKAENENLLDVPQKRDSFEDIAAGIVRRKNKRYSANPDEKKQGSIGTLPDSDGASQKVAPARFERSNLKKQTVIVTAGNPLLPPKSVPVEKKADAKITEKMMQLRKEMNKKKVIIRLFEIIREKGKSMTNQPPYAKSLEMTQNDLIEEISSLKSKVDDKEILELTEQFLNLIEERIVKGKLLRDTKRELNKLDGIVEQEQTPKTNIDRRPSLMKGVNFISPKSISFMHSLLKKSDSLGSNKSGKSDSRTSLTRDRKSSHSKIVQEQEICEESSPLIIKASSKPKLKKRLSKFGRLELQDADSCEGSKNSLVTGDPAGGLIQHGPFCSEDRSDNLSQLSKPPAGGHDSSIIESRESVTDSESEDTSKGRSNSASQGTSRSDRKKKTAHFRTPDKKMEILDLTVSRNHSSDKKKTAAFGHIISIDKLDSSEDVQKLPMKKKPTACFGGGAPSSIEEIVAREEEQLGLLKKKTGHFVNVASIEEMTPAFIKQSNKSSEDALQSRPSTKLGGFSGAIQEHSEYSNTDHAPSLSVVDNNKCSLVFYENFNNQQQSKEASGNTGSDGNQMRIIRKNTTSIDFGFPGGSQGHQLTVQTIGMIGEPEVILGPTVLYQTRSEPQNVLFEEKKIAEQPNKIPTSAEVTSIKIESDSKGDFMAAQNFSLSRIEGGGDDTHPNSGSKTTFSKNPFGGGGTPRHRSKSAIKTPTHNKAPQQSKDWDNIERINSESEKESSNSSSQSSSQTSSSKSSSQNSLTESSQSGNAFAEDFVNEKRKGNKKGKERVESLLLLDTALEKGYHSDSYLNTTRVTESLQPLIGMKDFEPIKMISKGAYGRVWLVKRKATNDFYAMKVVNLTEKFMKNTKELENLRKENKVFGLAQEDLVVRALFTFTYETCICFVMEYMLGGDFGDILYNYSALEEDVARFYIAEIILAVEYLHSLGIVHRDLKPDNILLDKKGHAKLTDFGLSETGLSKKIKSGTTNQNQEKLHATISRLCAPVTGLSNHINLKFKGKVMEKIHKDSEEVEDEQKEQESKTSLPSPREREDAQAKKKNSKRHNRLIGTPDYMAPEIILGGSVTSYSLDWWSLGCILFEFLVGIPPFNDDTQELVFDNIVNLRIPWSQITIGYGEDCVSPEAADLIQKLLTLDHTKRLGTNGVEEIKNHRFFQGIDWKNLRQQQPPIIPEHTSDGDTTNFVRLAGKLNEKENEDFFSFIPNKNAAPNLAAVKQYLESASESFNMFNIVALDSDNLKLAEEAMKQREEEMKRFRKHSTDDVVVRKNQYFDDVFDAPE